MSHQHFKIIVIFLYCKKINGKSIYGRFAKKRILKNIYLQSDGDYARTKCVRERRSKRAHWDRVDHVTAGIRDKAHKRRALGPRLHGYHELNIRVAWGFHQPGAVIPRIHPAKRSLSLSSSLIPSLFLCLAVSRLPRSLYLSSSWLYSISGSPWPP